MLPIIAAVMLAAQVPEAHAVLGAVRRRFGRRPQVGVDAVRPQPVRSMPVFDERSGYTSYSEQRFSSVPRPPPGGRRPSGSEGMAVSDETAGSAAPDATARLTPPAADDFQPDVPEGV